MESEKHEKGEKRKKPSGGFGVFCALCGKQPHVPDTSICDRVAELESQMERLLEVLMPIIAPERLCYINPDIKKKEEVILGIVGGRSFVPEDAYKKVMEHLKEWEMCVLPKGQKVIEIVSGGGRGIDQIAVRYARERDLPLTEHCAQWRKEGKAAGPNRNTLIAADCDYLVAFPSKRSIGTWDTVNKAREAGRCVSVYHL